MKKILMVAALAAMGAGAAPVVEITSVQQEYPWTNTVDITYTSTGITEENTYYVIFKAQDSAGNEIGVVTNDLKVSQGSTWVAQWQPPFNVRYENCTMTPYVYKGGMDDYMVIDLETWQMKYESMSVQAASNTKYNSPEYKTRYLVLRKIEAGDYYIGGPENSQTNIGYGKNSYHKVAFPKAFWFAIFELTEAQYDRIVNSRATNTSKTYYSMTWNTARGSAGSSARPSSGVFATLNSKTLFNGAKLVASSDPLTGFDLPTESMWEVAARAGCTTKWLSGDASTDAENYGWVSTNAKHEVGQKSPNYWGIYDVFGNAYEYTRDTWNSADLAGLQSANGFVPVSSGEGSYCAYRGSSFCDSATMGRLAYRHRDGKGTYYSQIGTRIAYIPE